MYRFHLFLLLQFCSGGCDFTTICPQGSVCGGIYTGTCAVRRQTTECSRSLLRQPIRFGRNGWPDWVLERVSQQGMAWGVSRTVLPADQVPRGVVQGIYLTQDHFSIIAALLWPPPWSVIMLPLLLLVPN